MSTISVLSNATIVNEGQIFQSHIVIQHGLILDILPVDADIVGLYPQAEITDCSGQYIFPGVIDDQVHFREPGLTHKANIYTESKAAVAGGVTSYMEMPNTNPPTLTQELLEEKYQIAAKNSFANYSFYMGCAEGNLDEVLKIDPHRVCGIKLFMGSSTGNMLVSNPEYLERLFKQAPCLIAVHCEDESIIQENTKKYKELYGEDVPIQAHASIRSEEACFTCSERAITLARKHNTHLHLLHLSTEKELALLDPPMLENKKITSEVCVHHLWFSEEDYQAKQTLIKWNPSIKKISDRNALRAAVNSNLIDVVATDHAPHTWDEKKQSYFKAPSGGPLVQFSLVAMLEMYHQGIFTLEQIVKKMSHDPARLFGVENRGFIRKGYAADLVVLDLNSPWKVDSSCILSLCKWSPFEGQVFTSKVKSTYVNGQNVYTNGIINEEVRGQRLLFNKKK